MKKYFLLLMALFWVSCTPTPNQNQKMVNLPESFMETQQKITTQQPEQKSLVPQTYFLTDNESKLTVKLPINCLTSDIDASQFRDPKSKNELYFPDCYIKNKALVLISIALQNQESITSGIDNYIANNGEKVCFDGPETCYKEDWDSERKIISIEKSALQAKSLPKNYDYNNLIGSYHYLLATGAMVPSGESWRHYITYIGNKRIVITFLWDYEREMTIPLKERYRKETDEFMKQVKMEMTLHS